MRILVTGATGYIGGRLVPRLLEEGHEVRCLTRAPHRLEMQPWRHRVEVVDGDVLDAAETKEAAAGCDTAYYLVHSMASGSEFDERDRLGAANFAEAAEAAGLDRVIYLGALGSPEPASSAHLRSRHEVGRILSSGATPVSELRAAIIIGSGSLSFEMIRYVTEALPVMVTPRWIDTKCQPISISDTLDALVGALDHTGSRRIDIGGPDVMTYREMIRVYADEAGLRRRRILGLPWLTPRLSSLWIGLVTPLPTRVARPLVESLRSDVVVGADDHMVGAMSYRTAVRRALDRLPSGIATRWSDAESSPASPSPADPKWSGGTLYLDRRVIPTDASAEQLYWAFSRIGGDHGYYWLDWAWRLRGLFDRLIGGVGLRRGRRHPTDLRPGEALDFWRVDAVEPGKRLRLRAEMKLPGNAWVEWEAKETAEGADLVQSAWFRPRGLWGRLYWYAMYPAHRIVFPRMACRIAATAEERGYACS